MMKGEDLEKQETMKKLGEEDLVREKQETMKKLGEEDLVREKQETMKKGEEDLVREKQETMKKGEEDLVRVKPEIITTTIVKPLSPVSELFVSPSLYCVIFVTLGFHTKCNPSIIAEGIKNTWLKLPRFRSKVEMKKNGKSFWVPVNVRVEDHVIVPDLDYSNIENPDQFIEDYTSSIADTPLDISKPLWEFHVLNIKTSNAESIGIGKLHHSLGDGMSLMSLLLASSRKISDPTALPTTAASKKQVDTNKGWCLVGRLWLVIRIIFITLIEVFKALLTLTWIRDTKTPLKLTPGIRTRSTKIIHRMISLDDVKLVKDTMKMKVNDVLLGMTQAGLSRYLSKKYGEDKGVEKKKILEKIRLRGTVAINLRPDARIEDLADMMAKGSKCRWGNFVGILIFPLWIKSEDDPLEYVRRAKATMDLKKISMESLLYYGLIKGAMKLLGEKVVENIATKIFRNTTLTFSNVMGPDEEISFFGQYPMSYVTASAVSPQQSLIIHYISYVNKIIINLAADTTVIPDPHLLCDEFVESLELIKLALAEKGVHKMEV